MEVHTGQKLALRPREAAEMLGISERTLFAYSAPRGSIPCIRFGSGKRKSVRYPMAELEAWLRRQTGSEKEVRSDIRNDGRRER
jgi:predicted DNA-binding transcriptional regulator AlpA